MPRPTPSTSPQLAFPSQSEFHTLCALTHEGRLSYLAGRLRRLPTTAEIRAFERSFESAVLAHNSAVTTSRSQPL